MINLNLKKYKIGLIKKQFKQLSAQKIKKKLLIKLKEEKIQYFSFTTINKIEEFQMR